MNATATVTTTTAAIDDDDIYCDCGIALTDAEIDESGYQCSKCHAATHFTCCDCGESFDNDDASPTCKSRCATCQETKDEAEVEAKKDALKEEAQDLLDSIFNDADLKTLQKAVAALKRLQPA